MAEVTPEEIQEASTIIVGTLVKWTGEMNDSDRVFRIYNEAIEDAVSFIDVMADKNPQHRLSFEILAAKMRKELPLMREEN